MKRATKERLGERASERGGGRELLGEAAFVRLKMRGERTIQLPGKIPLLLVLSLLFI